MQEWENRTIAFCYLIHYKRYNSLINRHMMGYPIEETRLVFMLV